MTKELNHIEAFIKAQQEMTAPKFNNINPHFKNKFADLAAVDEACKTALLNNGLTHVQAYKFLEVGGNVFWGIDTKIIHASTLKEVGSGGFYPISQTLNDQQKGSGTTYAKRYSLAMACNLVAEEDDDGNAASQAPKKAPQVSWSGPLQKTALKAKHKEIVMEIMACDQIDLINPLLMSGEFKPSIEQLKIDLPEDYQLLVLEIKNQKARIREDQVGGAE